MTASAFRFCDDLGPKTILHLFEPAIGLKAIAVVDNTAAGPAIGGVRMAPDVSLDECFRLARGMTLKNAAAGLPHGGGKSVIFGDPTTGLTPAECLEIAGKVQTHQPAAAPHVLRHDQQPQQHPQRGEHQTEGGHAAAAARPVRFGLGFWLVCRRSRRMRVLG